MFLLFVEFALLCSYKTLILFLTSISGTPGLVLSLCKFQWCGFSCENLQKIAQISSLCVFHSITEEILSLMNFWLLMTYVLQIWFMRIFVRHKKTHEPRTGCIYIFFETQKTKETLLCSFLFDRICYQKWLLFLTSI